MDIFEVMIGRFVNPQSVSGRTLRSVVEQITPHLANAEEMILESCGTGLIYLRVMDTTRPDPLSYRALLTFDLDAGVLRGPSGRKAQYSYSRAGWHDIVSEVLGEPTLQFCDEIHPYQIARPQSN